MTTFDAVRGESSQKQEKKIFTLALKIFLTSSYLKSDLNFQFFTFSAARLSVKTLPTFELSILESVS